MKHVLTFFIGAIIGGLAHDAGYGFLASMGWVVLVVALAVLYGVVDAARHD